MNNAKEALDSYLAKPPEFIQTEKVRSFRWESESLDAPVYITFNAKSGRRLLIPSAKGKSIKSEYLTRSIFMEPRNYAPEDVDEGLPYLQIDCADPNLNPTFDSLIRQYLSTLKDSKRTPLDTFYEVIEDWKDILREQTKRVHEQAVIGLFGELLLLEKLAHSTPGVNLNNWVGPDGSRHDFEATFADVEVKTTTRLDPTILHIDSPFQFLPEVPVDLYLVRIGLEIHSSGRTLIQLIDDLVNAGIDAYDIREKVEKALPGILTTSQDMNPYSATYFRVFRVNDSFPRISPSNDSEIPIGVHNITYDVDLTFADQLSADEADRLYYRLGSEYSD